MKTWPGRKLGDLKDVGDVRELSPSFSSLNFRLGPRCESRKLEMFANIFKKSSDCPLRTVKASISLRLTVRDLSKIEHLQILG